VLNAHPAPAWARAVGLPSPARSCDAPPESRWPLRRGKQLLDLITRASFGLSGPPPDYGCIRPPLHPARLRCSSLKYSRYSRSSRLAGRAHRRPRCVAVIRPKFPLKNRSF
jgi:hypothetical protein